MADTVVITWEWYTYTYMYRDILVVRDYFQFSYY